MANRIQNDYRSHMQGTSPDMDKLWNRIEQRIDNSQKTTQNTTAPAQSESQITVSKGGWLKYAAVAACLIAVVIGTTTLMRSKDKDITTETESTYAGTEEQYKSAEKEDATASGAKPQKKDDNVREKAVEESAADKVAGIPKTDTSGLAPNEQVKALMRTEDYKAADKDKRVELVENLAKEMKQRGEITKYEIFRRDSGDRIELTLPDEMVKGVILQ